MHKILIFSDSHGRNTRMERVLSSEKDFDAVWHLGDLEGSPEDLRRLIDRFNPLAACLQVRGNCDFSATLPSMKIAEVCGIRFLLTHGHLFRVNSSTELLASAARENDCIFALFGHTHVPENTVVSGVQLMNPGSISAPRTSDRRCSYGVLTVTEKRDVIFEVRYSDGTE